MIFPGREDSRSIEEAVAAIKTGPQRTIDVALMQGKFPEGRWFINGLGVGFEPLVTFAASSFKRISVPSYVMALIKVMINYPVPTILRSSSTGVSTYAKSQQLSVCNGRRMGSSFIMPPTHGR